MDSLSTGHLDNPIRVDGKADLIGLDICRIAWGELLADRFCDLIQQIIRDHNELFAPGDGTQMSDFNYVEDAALTATIVAEHRFLRGDVYKVPSDREYPKPERLGCRSQRFLEEGLPRTAEWIGQNKK